MNKIKGVITDIITFDNLSLITVDVDNVTFSCVVILHEKPFVKIGNFVFLLFKETEVSIGKNFSINSISLSNKIPCKITKIKKGKILTEIHLSFKGIKSIITTKSAEIMNLKENDNIIAFIKATEISLMEFK